MKKAQAKKQTASPLPPTGTNTDIANYLDYYCDAKNPFDFAVLIKGPWGSGKTHFIKGFMDRLKSQKGGLKVLYISLYGLISSQQIDDELFKEMHPLLSSKGAKIAATVLKGALKAGLKLDIGGKDKAEIDAIVPNINLSDYMTMPHSCVVVFDDLERCSMPLADVMGYINAFVEHDGVKAIIISNEDEIIKREQNADNQDSQRYAQVKEKLIGRTIEISAQTKEALKDFIKLIRTDKVRSFLEKNMDDILFLHQQSETNNLRILKQSLWDFERLANCISEDHWKKEEVVAELMRNVLVLCFESKTGHLTSDKFNSVLTNKIMLHLNKKPKQEETIAEKINKKYPQVQLDLRLLDADTLKRLIFDGQIDSDSIKKQLNESSYYAPPGSEPTWKIVCDGWRRSDKDFEAAAAQLEAQFKSREFEIAGELFLIFGIRLWLHDLGVIKKSKATIVRECESYLNSLLKKGKIEPKYKEESVLGTFLSWHGYGYPKSETPEFQRLIKKYDEVVKAATLKRLPADGKELLAIMASDQTKYIRMLCPNTHERAVYYDVPIFAHIKPITFVNSVLALDAAAQGTVFAAFKSRYDSGMLARDLKDEKPWLKDVAALFRKRAKNLRPMSRNRINMLTETDIDIFLNPNRK